MTISQSSINFNTSQLVVKNSTTDPYVGYENLTEVPDGWRFDIKRWSSAFDLKLPSLPRLADPSTQGVSESEYFQSGVGSVELGDLYLEEIEERIKFRNLFSQNAQDKIVLLSTHIIEDVQSICSRLIVINQGKILFDGRPEDLIQAAHGHVGITELMDENTDSGKYQITSRINTAHGISCRIVSEELPSFSQSVEPSLEDSYMYLIMKGSIV